MLEYPLLDWFFTLQFVVNNNTLKSDLRLWQDSDNKYYFISYGNKTGGMFLTPKVTKEMVEALYSPRILKTHSYYSDLGFGETFSNCKVLRH